MGAYLTLHKYTNKFYEINQIKNERSPLLAKIKFEPIFFQILWQFFNPKGSLLRQRRTGAAGGRGVGGNSARPTNFGRNQFGFFQIHTASW